jgi:hypothetical protein
MQRGATFDVRFDVEDQALHRRLVMAGADDLKRLHQRNAGRQHRCELAAENRNILGLDLATGFECRRLFLDLGRHDSLATQIGFQSLFIGRNASALEPLALFIHALPLKGHVLPDGADRRCCLRHGLTFLC